MSVDTHMNISPVLGTGADDKLIGTGRSEVISGAGGDDVIKGLSGNDEIFGGGGDDRIYGQAGNDTIYGNGKPAFVDMTDLTMIEDTTATVTFIDEGAGYRNSLGVYEIKEDGSFGNVQILFANASKSGSGGELNPNESQVNFNVSSGAQLGFFVVSNGYGKGVENRMALDAESGTFELRNEVGEIGTISGGPVSLWYIDPSSGSEYEVKSHYGADIFHSTANSKNAYQLNADNYLHVVGRANAVSGDLLIGFEDLFGGGDNDYDDTIINVNLGQNNIVAQLPVSTGPSKIVSDDDILYGGDGADIIYGIGGDDIIFGGRDSDELYGNSGSDSLFGSSGNDTLEGHSGNDFLSGGSGNDSLSGGSGNDRLMGDSGDDILTGASGLDFLYGGSGNDVVSGNSGDDRIYGENGNDTLNGNSGNDRISGGNGNDVLNGHSGDDILSGDSGGDRLIGGGGADILSGGDHNDRVYGGSGNDQLYGDAGNDYLTGSSGNDLLVGGAGNDKLFGGAGSDIFDLSGFETGDRDIIADFKAGDLVDFSEFNLTSLDDLLLLGDQTGKNTVFEFDEGYSVRLNNTELTEFVAEDFLF